MSEDAVDIVRDLIALRVLLNKASRHAERCRDRALVEELWQGLDDLSSLIEHYGLDDHDHRACDGR